MGEFTVRQENRQGLFQRELTADNRYLTIALWLVGGILVLCLAEILLPNQRASMIATRFTFPLVSLAASLAIFMAARRSARISRRAALAWGLIFLAQAVYTLGDITRTVIALRLPWSPGEPFADFPYLLFYPLYVAGLVLIPSKRYSREEWLGYLIDLCTSAIASFLIFWNLFISPMIQSTRGEPFISQALAAAYPAGDLLLLWGVMTVMVRISSFDSGGPMRLLGLSAIVTLVTDIQFSYLTLHGAYTRGGLLDIGWIISFLLIGLAGVHQYVAAGSQPAARQGDHPLTSALDLAWSRMSFHLPFFFLAAAFTLLVMRYYIAMPMGFLSMAIAVGIIFILVLIRQMIVLVENRKLTSRLQVSMAEYQRQAQEVEKTNSQLLTEIGERKRAESQLVYDSLHDSLTGLANRSLFTQRLAEAIQETHQRSDSFYSVLFIDLDDFKIKNESMGHPLGDRLLTAFSERLTSCLRIDDAISRLSGDEFAILLGHTREECDSILIASRIQAALHQPFDLGGLSVVTTASIGIVSNLTGYQYPEEILRDADIAVYRAKALGKDRYVIFTPGMLDQAVNRMQMENEIREALQNEELRLHYQPIFSLVNGNLTGFEALVRWEHPRRGLLPPAEFIQVAEESGLIAPLGKWVLRNACQQMSLWRKQFPGIAEALSISVNISGRQFSQAGFADEVIAVLDESGLSTGSLHLEITESIFIDNPNMVVEHFSHLHSRGVRLSIDDFQTGYSSLRYLHQFPVQCIKIDKSFVQDLAKNPVKSNLVQNMITTAKTLGMDAIAEGVETEAQLLELKSLNCPFAQGYLLGRPMQVEGVQRLLSERQ